MVCNANNSSASVVDPIVGLTWELDRICHIRHLLVKVIFQIVPCWNGAGDNHFLWPLSWWLKAVMTCQNRRLHHCWAAGGDGRHLQV